MQNGIAAKRERIRLAAETGWEDYELSVQRGAPASPAIIFVWYHLRTMQHIEAGTLTQQAILDLLLKKDELNEAFVRAQEERAKKKAAGGK